MLDNDERIIVLAQRIRYKTDTLITDTAFATNCVIEGAYAKAVLYVLQKGHLKSVRSIRSELRVRFGIETQASDNLLLGLHELNLVTTNRRLAWTAEAAACNPSEIPLSPRTAEDLHKLACKTKDTVGQVTGDSPLIRLLAERRSVRIFDQRDVPEMHVRSLVHIAAGTFGRHRTVPSGGALYPCGIHVIRRDGESYQTLDGRTIPARHVAEVFIDHVACVDGPLFLVISADYERASAKYGGRGWRYAVLEAGPGLVVRPHWLQLQQVAASCGAKSTWHRFFITCVRCANTFE